MAIIYTYPKLTNPQGNELIVVSDVNNRNSTRLITIASIASLVPSGGGCSTAITGIVDNLGASLYTALACSEMELVSTNGSVDIAATATGIDLTIDSAFDLECASAATLGGFLANQVAIGPPAAAGSGTYYPVEVSEEGCTGVVRIPDSATISCATSGAIGGIKVDPGLLDSIPSAVEGNVYPVQVDANCQAAVSIPSSETGCSEVWKTITNSTGSFSFDATACDDTLTLGSIGGTVTITSLAQGSVNFEVSSSPCATTTTRGGMIVGTDNTAISPVVDESGTAYAIEVNTSCEGFVRVPASGGGGGDPQGFSPLEIYSGNIFTAAPFTLASQAVSDITLDGIDRVKVFANGVYPTGVVQCHIWVAKMNDPAGMVFKGSGSLTGIVEGINIINLSAFDLVAGDNLVIYWTTSGEGLGLLGAAGIAGDSLSQASASYTPSPSNVLITALSPLTGSGSEEAAKRISCHFYKQP